MKKIFLFILLMTLCADSYGYAQTQQTVTMRGSIFKKSGVIKRVFSGYADVDASSYTAGSEVIVDLHSFGLDAGDTVDPSKLLIIVQGGIDGVWITEKGATYFKWASNNNSSGNWTWSWQAVEFD